MKNLKKRAWLYINELRICNLETVASKDPHKVYGSYTLDLGEFCMHGTDVNLDKRSGRLSHSWSSTTIRFMQQPIDYQLAKIPAEEHPAILQEVLTVAVFKQCYSYFQHYLGSDSPGYDVPLWEPPAWGHKPLAIPIEFIKARELIAGSSGNVFTNIYVGQHLVIRDVAIFNGINFSLKDPRPGHLPHIKEGSMLGELVRRLWDNNERLRRDVQHASHIQSSISGGDYPFFLDGRVHKESEKPPDPACLWDGQNYISVPRELAVYTSAG